jgi:protein-S-isoprenylcysteine O-methyltransferase Ste14
MTGGDIQVGGNLILAMPGGLLASIGIILAAWATIALRKGGQHPDPARATTALVTDGPYEYSRNPIYLSFISLSLGVGLLLNSYWVLGAVPISVIGLQILVIPREER